ncbi:hypothetical protein GIB67_033691 [Kingdonia uniflora]|uniref:Uncharacterized protein n=1 Tax=Kingdonia uniflora TaxID=39325 RepID=A0A7J7P3Y4_9MAGN|nr:hypothetical protein GIB67_033691 [Kingdonia uniflora]
MLASKRCTRLSFQILLQLFSELSISLNFRASCKSLKVPSICFVKPFAGFFPSSTTGVGGGYNSKLIVYFKMPEMISCGISLQAQICSHLHNCIWYLSFSGSPVNTFEFLHPLLKSLEYELPKATLEVPQALMLGRIFWAIYTFLYPWLNRSWLPRPLILPAEVYKVGVTHYFSFLKAKEELGYVPMVSPQEGMSSTITYWQERKRRELDGPTIYAWLFSVIGMSLTFITAFLQDIGPMKPIRYISLFIFRSIEALQIAFYLAVAAHIIEATYAWYLAKRVDPANAKGWFWQTFALGFFSLRILLKRAQNK